MPRGNIHIGISGWSYPQFGKGRFYPVGLRPGDYLRHYAQHFNTVEINASFYRPPTPLNFTRWCEAVPPKFRFAIKLWRRITHEKGLRDTAADVARFLAAAAVLGDRRGPLLVQLPPSLRPDPPLLDAFLTDIADATTDRPWRVALEVRNIGWLSPGIYRVLNQHRAALCLADMPRCTVTEPGDADFVYMRRHGPCGDYRGCYTPAQIAADARHISAWLGEERDVFVYYNNTIDSYAIDNAQELAGQVT